MTNPRQLTWLWFSLCAVLRLKSQLNGNNGSVTNNDDHWLYEVSLMIIILFEWIWLLSVIIPVVFQFGDSGIMNRDFVECSYEWVVYDRNDIYRKQGLVVKYNFRFNRVLLGLFVLQRVIWFLLKKRYRLYGKGYSSDDSGDGPELKKHDAMFPDYVDKTVHTGKPKIVVKQPQAQKPSKIDEGLKQLQNVAKDIRNTGENVSNRRSKQNFVRKHEHNKNQDSDKKPLEGAQRRVRERDSKEERVEQRKFNAEEYKNEIRVKRENLYQQKLIEDEYKKKEEAEKLIVRSNFSNWGYDGEKPVKFIGEHVFRAVGSDGRIYNHVPEGTIVQHTIVSGVGFLVVPAVDCPGYTSGFTAMAKPSVIVEEIGQPFTLFGVDYATQQYNIFLPILDFCRSRISVVPDRECIHNMLLSACNKQFPMMQDDDLLISTINFYVHNSRFRQWKKITGDGRIIKDERDRIVDQYMNRTVKEVRFAADVVVYNSVDCGVPDTYNYRDDIVIERNDGVSFGKKDSPIEYPSFRRRVRNNNGERYRRTNFLSFQDPLVDPFITYSVNDNNMLKALKRIVGDRPNDSLMTALQYSCFFNIFQYGYNLWKVDKQKFLEVGRLFPSYDANGFFESVRVGHNSTFASLGRVAPVIVNPVTVAPYYGLVDSWFSSRDSMNSVYPGSEMFVGVNMWKVQQAMLQGFEMLMGNTCRFKVQQYSDSHPSWSYGVAFRDFINYIDSLSSRLVCAGIKHVKKALRMNYVENEFVHTVDDNMVRNIDSKVKKEFAKPGKVPRLFTTYGGGCMYANELPEFLKVCIDGTYSFPGIVRVDVTIFAKPSTHRLSQLFVEAVHACDRNNYVHVVIYSDDSLWSGCINHMPFAFNVDISSCDSGNKGGVFGLIWLLLSRFDVKLATGLVSQCTKPIRCASDDKTEMLRVHVASFFEGSGTVLTTVLNHVAMFMICSAFSSIVNQVRVTGLEHLKKVILLSGMSFGHVLTIEVAMTDAGEVIPEKMQFLKRSPLRSTTGRIVPTLNYGTIFRSFGSVEEDLVGVMLGVTVTKFCQMSLGEKCDSFLSKVVAGLVHEPSSIVMTSLRQRFSELPNGVVGGWELMADHNKYVNSLIKFDGDSESVDFSKEEISVESLCRRYDLSVDDLVLFQEQILRCRVSNSYNSRAVGNMFVVDYGCSR